MNKTDEQLAVIDAFRDRQDLIVEARAGCGKTSTQRMCAEANPYLRGVLITFSKAIAEDAKRSFPSSCRCSTIHSLAYGAVGWRYQERLEGPRVTSTDAAHTLGVRKWLRLGPITYSPAKVTRLALETVDRFCNSAEEQIEAKHMPWIKGLEEHRPELAELVVPIARRAWAEIQQEQGKLKFTHDCYLKLYALTEPYISCDYLLFDEAQDSSPVITYLVALQEQAQKVVVGDPMQQIYAWRGAINAMDTFGIKRRMPLAQSFRFGQPIADEANVWLEKLDADPLVTGSDWIESRVGRVEKAKAVLCRTNAQAVVEVLDLQGKGIQPAVVGGTGPIVRFAEAAIELRAGKGSWHPDLQGFKTWEQVQEYVKQDRGGYDLRTWVRLIDQYKPETVIALMQNCLPETVAEVIVSTAHKAKGREWDTVRLADDFQVQPRKDDKGEWQEPPEEELRLAYVACTRARHELDPRGLYNEAEVKV